MEKESNVEVVYSLSLEKKTNVDNKIRELENLLQTTFNDLENVREHTKKIVVLMDFEETQEVRDSQMEAIIELDKLRQALEQSLINYTRTIAEGREIKESLQKMHEMWLEILQSSPKDNPQ